MSALARWSDPTRAGSLAARARAGRWVEFSHRFPDIASMRVLDLGGTPGAWIFAPGRPEQLVTVNLDAHPSDEPWVRSVAGDACRLPDDLVHERFDLVYSSSLIEHVGGLARRKEFAGVVEAAAPRHWIQTPYRYFPVEPHWVFPGFQWLPLPARAFVARHWKHGHIRSDASSAVANSLRVELLGKTEFAHLFPDSELWSERVVGMTKSLVAIR